MKGRLMKFAIGAVLYAAMALFVGAPPAHADGEPASGLVFRAVAGTNLAEIFTRRRNELIERKGGKLGSHDWWLWGLAAFDYDRDGDLDLIACVHGATNGVIIKNRLRETGNLTFVDATEELGVDGLVPSTDDYPLVWDFDGDGYLDVAGLLDDRRTPCLWNRQGRTFEAAGFSLHPINHPTAVIDLDGDGYLDVYQNPRRPPGTRVAMVYDPAQKTFIRQEADCPPPVAVPEEVRAELAAFAAKTENRWLRVDFDCEHDLNGDGRRDAIVGGFSAYGGDRFGRYLFAEADGRLVDRTQAAGLPREGTPMHVDDVDGDGDVDVLIAAAERGGLYLNDGNGRFALKAGLLTDFIKPRCPYLHRAFRADLDNDGDADLAVSNRRYGRECIFENAGGGEFRLSLQSRGWDADPLVLADVNDDGRIDVLIGGAGQKENVGIFLNETPEVGDFCKLFPRAKSPNVYAVGTRIEVFAPGTMGKPAARPLLSATARPDGRPIHVGLGNLTHFDLRVTFPGQEPRQWPNIAAKKSLTLTELGPDGP